ncbi:MAG: hypothetical protein GIKADHBN_00237 [Phycisphaerales bacterium]|nr:hypothetical protein [Phycisphaerales bacterium]
MRRSNKSRPAVLFVPLFVLGTSLVFSSSLVGCDKRESTVREESTRKVDTPEGTKETTVTTEKKTEVDPK